MAFNLRLNEKNMFFDYFNKSSVTLNKVRQDIINFCFNLATVICLIMLIVRIVEQKVDMIILTIIALLLSIFFTYFSRKGHTQKILFISNILYLFIAFKEGMVSNIPIQTIIYFSCIPLIAAFLLDNERLRIIVFITNIITFLTLNYVTQSESWSNVITFLISIIFVDIMVLMFIRRLEYQEERLMETLNDKKETLEQLEEKHEDVLLFNSMMNHDIKAPIRTIKGFTKILKSSKNISKQELEYLNFIDGSTQNLESLIFDLLTLSKVDSSIVEKKMISVNNIIDITSLNLSYDINDKKVKINRSEIPDIFANHEFMKTVFQNVISNGIKYQPKSPNHIPQIDIYCKSDKTVDKIYIQDNGIGIKAANVDKIFSPFLRFHSTEDYEGTGLGMTICKRIMKKHNGDINYFHNDKTGSCFELIIPKK